MFEDGIKEIIEEEVRPFLRSHGGDCEFVGVEKDGVVKVRLTGACAHCPGAQMTLQGMVKELLCSKIPNIKDVIAV